MKREGGAHVIMQLSGIVAGTSCAALLNEHLATVV